MKILELTNYSAGICGVYSRVKQEALLLAQKGNEVKIFSSNRVKGFSYFAPEKYKLKSVVIQRFSAIKLGGESFMYWNFKKEALTFNPDIIIAHSYRQLHTTQALSIAKEIGAKVLLVTHAPFARTDTRSLLSRIAVSLYDFFIGPKTLSKFKKVIAITKWEIPYLQTLGLKKNQIEYIPNGLDNEFFAAPKLKIRKSDNSIIFLGRISYIKNIETLLKAISLIKKPLFKLTMVGPVDAQYKKNLQQLIMSLNIKSRVHFEAPIYNIKEKINILDKASIFVLPSKSEGMPQSLQEAMARGKIVLASDIPATRDIIQNNKNGFLFQQGNTLDCAAKLKTIYSLTSQQKIIIGKKAKFSMRAFAWKNQIHKLEALYN